jgi:hypothetical protein
VNGDGKLDLVVGNLCPDAACIGDGLVAVLLGNDHGTFKTPVTYGSGGRTLEPAVADINGDGKLDLVVLNACDTTKGCTLAGGSTVGVLLGNGDGTFRPVVTRAVGEKFTSRLSLGDVDGDGKLDIVVSECAFGQDVCERDGLIGVLLGNGDGTFQQPVTYGAGGWSSDGVMVADLNSDGQLDIVVTNCGANTSCNSGIGGVGVLMNNSGPHSPTATTLRSSQILASPGQLVTYTATVTS